MMKSLNPCLIFSSGIAGTGKTTIMKGVAKEIPNSFYLDRDDINQAYLHIPVDPLKGLLDFKDYVAQDEIFLDNKISTPFGEMFLVAPSNAFYRRHVRDQSYIAQTFIAKTNLDLGKIIIVDCITIRQIKDGTLEKIINQPLIAHYPIYLIHFIADEEDCYNRIRERAKNDIYASRRIENKKTESRDIFHKFVTEEQPMIPEELKKYDYLLINTSKKSIIEDIKKCIEYVS